MSSIHTSQVMYFLAAYFFAAIPFGVVVSRLVIGKDVRSQGSGNIGATNVARLMGKKWGVLVLILDALKGFITVRLAMEFGDYIFYNAVAVLAVLAHCYPIYLKFKGGKGVATALGVVGAIAPFLLGIAFIVFALVFKFSRRVSPASLTAALSVPIGAIFWVTDLRPAYGWLICAIIWWKHRENVQRLLRGKEPRFF